MRILPFTNPPLFSSYRLPFIVLFSICLNSCENNIAKIKLITSNEKLPVDEMKDVNIFYSDSARVKVKISAPVLLTFDGEEKYVEMPEGVLVLFYDKFMIKESELIAKYAIRYENEERMEARDSVVVTNDQNEELYTDHLIWDEKSEKLYSDDFVRITTVDEVIFGKGFEADQNFENYEIKQISGTISIANEFAKNN